MPRLHLVLSLILLLSATTFVKSDTDILPPLITVSGTGESKRAPDEVSVTVGVQLRDKSVQAVSKQTDDRSAAIIAFLLAHGVAANNVQTSYVTLQPYFSWQSTQAGSLTPDYYTATKSITFVLKDLSLYDQIMTGLYGAGINSVSDVTFKVTSIETRRQEARKKAVANAKSIAETLASGLGARITGVYSVSDSSAASSPSPVIYAPMAAAMSVSSAGSASYSASGPSVAGGEVSTSSTVSVSFYVSNNNRRAK